VHTRQVRAGIVVAAAVAVALASMRPSDDQEPPIEPTAQPVVSAVTTPTPEPPPWHGLMVATVVRGSDGEVIVFADADDLSGNDAGPAWHRLPLVFEQIADLAWSPDASQLAFSALRDGNWDIYRVGRDGADLVRLTEHAAYDGQPSWAPDATEMAFTSYRDGNLDLYRSGTTLPEQNVSRLTNGDSPSIEPAWSPEGGHVAFSAWRDGRYSLATVEAGGGDAVVVYLPEESQGDVRDASWSSGSLAFRLDDYGQGQVALLTGLALPGGQVGDRAVPSTGAEKAATKSRPQSIVARAAHYSWLPDGQTVAFVTAGRGARSLEVQGRGGRDRQTVGELPDGALEVAWAPGPPPLQLALWTEGSALRDGRGAGAQPGSLPAPWPAAAVSDRPGLARLPDVAVSGPRIHAGLADDYAALRAEVRTATGRDFLGTLSDMWRPLDFSSSASAFFSWHKTGRAFDTVMQLRGPGGRNDLVLVREDTGGSTMWRMYLRAADNSGATGRPLLLPGWTFSAGGGDEAHESTGGLRGTSVPAGYFVDFTAMAARYGWHRIPSLSRTGLDWRRDWAAIEFWHYERRDGLRWFEAAREVYSDDDLALALHRERLQELGVQLGRLTRLGFPPGWVSGS
jgi:TolB protein